MVIGKAGLAGDDYPVTPAVAAPPRDAGETFEDGSYEYFSRTARQRLERSAADPHHERARVQQSSVLADRGLGSVHDSPAVPSCGRPTTGWIWARCLMPMSSILP
jgi:hypothetical protein